MLYLVILSLYLFYDLGNPRETNKLYDDAFIQWSCTISHEDKKKV